ncbi:TaqI-like C-terminal specificity domain-containing protein [Lewinella sp. W8]|uniref:Eco57I restriction-modification methylase domain-containing protein n=1 Tax=Lewinella sp. W8 TaxID=2528208 RepID=UPI0010675AEA|nr:TaqI-like C-terminal specificity domain-containing protein [Lewinella sp. W8]MTB50685.1 hypothetical protein [Lewinella sp. W8]
MREKDLKRILQQPYSFDNWKELLPMFFKKVQYFSQVQALFDEREKVVQGKQIGRITLDDDKSLAIFDVEVADKVVIARNRKELRDIAIKHIDQDITHGAIVFFHNSSQKDYRFSFIAKWSALDMETGEFIKGETKPKRYTYLLGPNEACTTAAKRLLTLIPKQEAGEATIKEVQQVFSVEALNREFFKSYKIHYEKFWKYLAESPWRDELINAEKEETDKKEKPIRDFVKKLLGRIVFLHFLQKKGWMGCSSEPNEWQDGEKRFMQVIFEEFADKEHFHSKCLTKLFFETLNTKRPNGVFHIAGLEGKLSGSHVPYLNGGLFEPEKNKATFKVDFPVQYFEELLEFFEQYNFTIDENSPDDHEVGIDPEMLGHIFENLLEENREKGAFYTPKEIVQYMCQESLIQYLYNHFDKRQDIDEFIRQHSVSAFLAERDKAAKLNQLLDDIKVCDPAIGSGAFPIGMLQEIFESKRFIYPYLKTSQPFDPAATKKNIIQNSIYGVDIEKGAVDIAQLRFWLALVVEEVNPHPLPNLDYKIMQGNSLLEQYEGIDLSKVAVLEEPQVTVFQASMFEEPDSSYGFGEENRKSIKQLVQNYFQVEDREEKSRIHKAIDSNVLNHIDKSLEGYENQLLIEIAAYEKRYKAKTEGLSESQKAQYDRKSKELREIGKRQKQLENKAKARQNLLKFEETDERPYFLWHLYFMDVFDKGGFDVMIGNPPYIQLQKIKEEASVYQDAKFDTFSRSADIYCLFYEKGTEMLKSQGGVLSFITSNSWMRAKYGKALRQYFRANTNPVRLLNFEDTLLFPAATVETNILVLKREKFKGYLQATAVQSDLGNTPLASYQQKRHIVLDSLNDDGWSVADPEDYRIKLMIEEAGVPLGQKFTPNRGILTGYNKAFIIKTGLRNKLIEQDPKNSEIIKRFLSGRDLSKYRIEWNDDWLINAHNGVKNELIPPVDVEKDYPTLFQYFSNPELKDRLLKRSDQGNHWTNLRDCAYILDFEKPKLIWAELSDLPKFVYDEEGYYTNKTTFILTGDQLKYLMVLLNSKTLVWYFSQISTSSGMGTTMWNKYKVEQIPVVFSSDANIAKVENIGEVLLYLNDPASEEINEGISNQRMSDFFEDIANMIVYELYFEKEMKDKELDVLQFINEKSFPDISEMNPEEKKATIQKMYYELQQKDNPIRNRILVSESRSEIIRRINDVTGS